MTLRDKIEDIVRMRTNQLGNYTTKGITDAILSAVRAKIKKMPRWTIVDYLVDDYEVTKCKDGEWIDFDDMMEALK